MIRTPLIAILALAVTLASAQSPSTTRLASESPRPSPRTEWRVAQPHPHRRSWMARHPALTGIMVGAGAAVVIGVHHRGYKCYAEGGEYYTGTPSGQPGLHGCPLGQTAK